MSWGGYHSDVTLGAGSVPSTCSARPDRERAVADRVWQPVELDPDGQAARAEARRQREPWQTAKGCERGAAKPRNHARHALPAHHHLRGVANLRCRLEHRGVDKCDEIVIDNALTHHL